MGFPWCCSCILSVIWSQGYERVGPSRPCPSRPCKPKVCVGVHIGYLSICPLAQPRTKSRFGDCVPLRKAVPICFLTEPHSSLCGLKPSLHLGRRHPPRAEVGSPSWTPSIHVGSSRHTSNSRLENPIRLGEGSGGLASAPA